PDVLLRPLRQEPAMLEHLVKDLRRREPPLELARHGEDGRLEHLLAPARRDDRFRERPLLAPLERLAKACQVVEHPLRLPLLRVEPGEAEQAVAVMARLGDERIESEPVD